MDVSISGHNLDITPRLEKYVEKKTSRLDRYLPDLIEAHVELAAENTRSAVERQVAQITIRDSRGTILRAEERSNDIFAAIDAVVDKLYHQITRYRGKRERIRRGGGEPLAADELTPLTEEGELPDEGEGIIVRRKGFALQPMSAEEAIDQMELLGHNFYVFFDAEDEAVNVVYKRRDGNYGLLQPELD